jgi:uncharacterized membrane protein YphA (DoxX/SURF4 family)
VYNGARPRGYALPPKGSGDHRAKGGSVVANIYVIALLIGRILVGGFFIIAGINHFAQLKMMAGYAKMKGTPAPEVAVSASGVLLLLGGISLLLGFHPTIGVILLLIFLLPTTFLIHNFWAVQDPQAKMNDLVNFEKNIAIIGFLLMTLLITRPWPMSLGQ